MQKLFCIIALCAVAPLAAIAQGGGATPGGGAQTPPADSLATYLQKAFKGISANLIGSAEQMPEANYKMKLGAMPEVRTFAATLGHIINSNYFYCARAKGEAIPAETDYENTLQTKAQLVKAMHDAIGYCSVVYDALTDATAMQTVIARGPSGPGHLVLRVQVLFNNIGHDCEVYGSLVGYFRTANLVPPSTAAVNAANSGGHGS